MIKVYGNKVEIAGESVDLQVEIMNVTVKVFELIAKQTDPQFAYGMYENVLHRATADAIKDALGIEPMKEIDIEQTKLDSLESIFGGGKRGKNDN